MHSHAGCGADGFLPGALVLGLISASGKHLWMGARALEFGVWTGVQGLSLELAGFCGGWGRPPASRSSPLPPHSAIAWDPSTLALSFRGAHTLVPGSPHPRLNLALPARGNWGL